MYLLDSNILLHYVRSNPIATAIEQRYALTTVMPIPIASVVSEGELRSLALQFDWGAANRHNMENLLGYFRIIPLMFENIVDIYAEIDDYSRRRGVGMGKNDLWIAATARVTEMRLLTTDRDFDHLHGVFLERDWVDPAAVR